MADPADPAGREPAPLHAARNQVVRSLLRICLGTIAILCVYFVFPLDDREDAAVELLAVVGGLVVFALIFWRQIRLIRSAEYPLLRAVEAIALVATIFIVLMSTVAAAFSTADASNYSEPLSRTDALYFTVTTLATVGFGDITPTATVTRLFTTFQILLGVGLLGVGLRSMVTVAKQVAEARGESDEATPGVQG
jgi:voltage-gated potassium channel Kch